MSASQEFAGQLMEFIRFHSMLTSIDQLEKTLRLPPPKPAARPRKR